MYISLSPLWQGSQSQPHFSTIQWLYTSNRSNCCEVMSIASLWDVFHTLRLASFYGSPTYFSLKQGMGLSVSPDVFQQFIDNVYENIPKRGRFKIIMDDSMIFSTHQKQFQDLAIFFKALIKFGLKISPHECQFLRDQSAYMGLPFTLKDGNPSYTQFREITLQLSN